jgi:hemerythrin-like domain-containing protein
MKATDILKDEHRHIERMLIVLDHASSRLLKGEKIPPEVFRDAIHFLRSFADKCHHAKEETLLFPAMVQKGFPREAGPVAVMLAEHEQGRAEVSAMHDALERYSADKADGVEELVAHAHRFITLLREHISKEDNVLFAMANQHFSANEQTALLQDFKKVEGSGEACATKTDLVALLKRMEREASAKSV